jgi:hypothetical protein
MCNAAAAFHDVRWYVEIRMRNVLQRRAHRYGRGWKRYDHAHLYGRLKLYDD